MKHLTFWFDPISPFAYLAFERLPQVLEGVSCSVDYRPVLFAGLLRHWGQKGPAEIEPKRAWTFRHVHWLAAEHGIALDTPATHPFNPLPLLRLLYATAPAGGLPNRHACEAVLRHVWTGGAAADDPARLAALTASLAPAAGDSIPVAPSGPSTGPDADSDSDADARAAAAKLSLRTATEAAIGHGVFGVPTIELDGRWFWGFDSLPMVAACARGDAWFDSPAWAREGAPRPGVVR